MSDESSRMQSVLPTIVTAFLNGFVRARNTLAAVLPGDRPGWLVLNLRGSYPALRARRQLVSLETVMGSEPEQSLEEVDELVTALLEEAWLAGVVVRFAEGFEVDWATAYALRRQLTRLREGGKRVVVTASRLDTVTYYLASVADEVVMPEGAELAVTGSAASARYSADFLGRYGVKVDKAAIREYKSAMENLVLPRMSDGQREQLTALLESRHQVLAREVGTSRGVDESTVSGWVDDAVTSAVRAAELGMIDRVAYEDELVTKDHKPLAAAARFLRRPLRASSAGRVAVVSLEGSIVTGKSRKLPLPLPIVGGAMAGSESLVAALREAREDKAAKALVFHVDSGGGSALASDLIGREIELTAARMPVVAVMGSVAASGGYYVLTHATKVLAAPTTITGSIGVLTAKFVLEEFERKFGFLTETVKYGRFADVMSSPRAWDDAEREWMMRSIEEVYDRFVTRVATGRDLAPERVNEIGRGRVWSGQDALELGLVDELGDVSSALALAKELAGLSPNAPVKRVTAPAKYVLPVADDVTALIREAAPLLRERVLALAPGVGA